MKLLAVFAACFLVLFGAPVFAQQDFYSVDHSPQIKITFAEDNWDEILDTLFLAGEEDRLTCNIELDGEVFEGVGIRYKGFSSVSTDREKNPFNIKLDYSDPDASYQGIDKIKLANVIQDPSFLREVLSYQIARKYLPSGRANFAQVYINEVYWGLYTNVESVDKQFLQSHYWTTTGAFFKCNPASLDLFGENANLSDTPGVLAADYADLYDLKSDTGYDELLELIQVLNEEPENIEQVLHVDRTLWMHAFNYALINFDSYVGYAQNYYLYQDFNGQFNPILWDLNMSFASFRLTDGSEFYDGFSIAEAQTIDPLTHLENVSVFPRPLLRNLLENSTYKRMYLAHLRTIIEENISNDWYVTQAELHRDFIDPWVEADTNKFYGYDDFLANLESTVTDLVDYPGLTELMEFRSEYLLNYPGLDSPPTIQSVELLGAWTFGESVTIEAEILDADEAMLFFRFGSDGVFQWMQMQDNGEGVFVAEVANVGNQLEYYVYAQNEVSGRFAPERAAEVFFSAQAVLPEGALVINEVQLENANTQTDDSGEFDDWIEFYNLTDTPISTDGLFLSDDESNPFKWAMPSHFIPSGGYAVIWADEDGDDGHLHANFQLAAAGEMLLLSDSSGTVLDQTFSTSQGPDIAWARFPNGTGPFVAMNPTFNGPNQVVGLQGVEIQRALVYPNPCAYTVHFSFPMSNIWTARLMDVHGREIRSANGFGATGSLPMHDLPVGFYVLNLKCGSHVESRLLNHIETP